MISVRPSEPQHVSSKYALPILSVKNSPCILFDKYGLGAHSSSLPGNSKIEETNEMPL